MNDYKDYEDDETMERIFYRLGIINRCYALRRFVKIGKKIAKAFGLSGEVEVKGV